MTTGAPLRQFAVILHADVAGSTWLVQRDETVAHERVTGAFDRLSGFVARYGGTVHEVRGDEVVAEFSRASDGVACSLAFQRDNAAVNTLATDDIRPEIRVGVSLGEIAHAHAPYVRVMSRTASFAYQGKRMSAQDMGKVLDVKYVLDGSVQKGENAVRIIAQLIDVSNGHHVWAEKLDETGSDVLGLQDAVTRRISGALGTYTKGC